MPTLSTTLGKNMQLKAQFGHKSKPAGGNFGLALSLDFGSYQTVWATLHRLRSVLVRPGLAGLRRDRELRVSPGAAPPTWRTVTHMGCCQGYIGSPR